MDRSNLLQQSTESSGKGETERRGKVKVGSELNI